MTHQPTYQYVHIRAVLAIDNTWGGPFLHSLSCPLCQGAYHQWEAPREIAGGDRYAAGWGGRGDLLIIPIDSDCGHAWEVCLGQHKGTLAIFARYLLNPGELIDTEPTPGTRQSPQQGR